jgi:hypothetical protein
MVPAVPVTTQDTVARCARYDHDRADPRPTGKGLHVLVLKRSTASSTPSRWARRRCPASHGQARGWSMQVTDKGGAIRPEVLARYDLVVWNNISGDALTMPQRDTLRRWIERGGGYVGLHGAAGDPVSFWDWYNDTLVGATFLGHPANPQFPPGHPAR